MENEAPKYASWIPEAGGYVANGKVVSKSPIYENGKLKLDVDTSVFGNTQPQNTVQQTGMQTLNTQGSGTDVNWGLTGAGSLASTTTNTATTGSAISTPVVNSPLVKYNPQNDVDRINEELKEYYANNNYKGVIDKLTELSQIDGVDRTAQINELWKKRGEKVRAQDNAYLNSIQQIRDEITNTQIRSDLTDEEKAKKVAELRAQEQALLEKQQSYREMVGYDDQIARDTQAIQQQTYEDYVSRYMDGINTMTNMIVQSLQGILDFQYNPYTDPALNIAQGYAVGKVKETMNATGMYDSSMTQRAITKAVAELVPVYEKMAKEEAIQNLQLLQQTASFLVTLDQYEFDMWRAQIEMRWEEANQKQKQIDNAINNANARGYYTNEEAIMVGVPAGSESQKARQDAIDKLNKIEEEQRKFTQDIALAKYQHDLSIDYLKEQYKQMKDYYNYQETHQKNTGGSDGSGTKGEVTIKITGDNDEEITLTMDYDEAVAKGYISGKDTNGEKTTKYVDPNTGKEYIVENGDFIESFKNADGTYDMKKVEKYIKNDLKNASNPASALSDINTNIIMKDIQNYADDFGDDRNKSRNAFTQAFKEIEQFSTWVRNSGVKGAEYALVGADLDDGTGKITSVPGLLQKDINTLIEQVNKADNIDNVWGDWDKIHGNAKTQIADSKANTKRDIYNLIANSEDDLIKNKLTPQYTGLQKDALKVAQDDEKRANQLVKDVLESPIARNIISGPVGLAQALTDKLVDSWYPNI